MLTPIQHNLFYYGADPVAFRAYREIKYRVFVEELGWADLADARNPGLIKVDAYDPISSFALLSTASGEPFAIVRATALYRGFPYRELFERHLAQPAFADHLDWLCSINALAVLPDYRRRVFRESAHGWQGSAGQLLLLGILGHMAGAGLAGAILTTGYPAASRLCRRVGFEIIDPPVASAQTREPLQNMALLFDDPAYLACRRACGVAGEPPLQDPGRDALARYFGQCRPAAAS